MDLFLFFVLTGCLIGLAVYFYRQDRRRERLLTRDAISPTLRTELDAEHQAAVDRAAKFREALKQAAEQARKP